MAAATTALVGGSGGGGGGGGMGGGPGSGCRELARQGSQQWLFDDGGPLGGGSGSVAPLDLWRVHLAQCPECGRVHGGAAGAGAGGVAGHGGGGGAAAGVLSRPERHLYDYAQSVSEDLLCPLCGDALQSPVQTPCGHHYCSVCMRTLLTRTAGKVACPLDGQVLTRFALMPADGHVLGLLGGLRVRCPVCGEQVRKADLQLHLQDPVNMVEPASAYEAILRPFYMSCPLSNFTVGELNGSSALIRFYRRLGEPALRRFVLATEDFIVLPDPKMGFQPHTEEDVKAFRKHGGYFNAWWVHPSFRPEVWWRRVGDADPTAAAAGAGPSHPADAAFRACREALKKRDEATSLLGSLDCSSEPWHESSFMHTWSSVRKPTEPRYLCCLRDLREADLPMLEAFRADVLRFLRDNYAVDEDKVWIYCHYPSSARYSTLHFHIIFSGEEGSRYAKYAQKLERPHQLSRQFPLSQIIETLRRDPRYFETCTLRYFLGDKADLMDPISAFFGCSPHRYVEDFTFHWDPSAVAPLLPPLPGSCPPSPSSASAQALAVPRRADAAAGSSGGSAAAAAAAAAGAAAAAAEHGRLAPQLAELRRAVEASRQSVEQLTGVVRDMAKRQEMEESGASKLALLQLASLAKLSAGVGAEGGGSGPPPAGRPGPKLPLWQAALLGAVSGLVAGAACTALLVASWRGAGGRRGGGGSGSGHG